MNLRLLIIAVGLLVTPMLASAQQGERIRSHKRAFITEKVNLTPAEAEKFWPVYNEYQNKLDKIKAETRQAMAGKWTRLDELSDSEVEGMIDAFSSRKERELALFKEYNDRFKKVLPVKKVARLYVAERTFQAQLVKRLQERRQNNRAGGMRGR